MVYSPSKLVFVPETWLPLRKITTEAKGSGSPESKSVTFPFNVPEPTWARPALAKSKMADINVANRIIRRSISGVS